MARVVINASTSASGPAHNAPSTPNARAAEILKITPSAVSRQIHSLEDELGPELAKEEYLKCSEAMMDKPRSYYAFEMLYWFGMRSSELLALTPADIDFEKQNDLKGQKQKIEKSLER